MKKSRMRIIIWIGALIFMLLVTLWEVNKIRESEDLERPTDLEELVDEVDVDKEVLPKETIDEEEEEDQELLQLLVPGFIADDMNSGQEAGTLSIPVINFEMKILADATAANLNRAPALMKSTHFPGEVGNAVISGHRMYEFGSHFNRIDELKIGDKLYFETMDKKLEFVVEQIMVVDPAEIWITLGDQREARLTLFACTPIRIATHRIAVFAVLNE